MVLGPRPERVYSHALLLQLKEHPLARQWPPYLDPAFKNARGVWDPDRWHLERKRGETPTGLELKDGPDGGKENIGRKEAKKEVWWGPRRDSERGPEGGRKEAPKRGRKGASKGCWKGA